MKNISSIVKALRQRRSRERNPVKYTSFLQDGRTLGPHSANMLTIYPDHPSTRLRKEQHAGVLQVRANPCCPECAENPYRRNPLSYQSGPDRQGFTAGGSASFIDVRARGGDNLGVRSSRDGNELHIFSEDDAIAESEAGSGDEYNRHHGRNPPIKNAATEAKAKAIADLIDREGVTVEAEMAAGYATRGMKHWEKLAFVERVHELRRKKSSNPELLTVGLNPEGGRKVSHCIKVKSHKRCYKKTLRRKRSRGAKVRHRRRSRRGGRVSRRRGSWKGFVRKHRGVMKRLGLKRGIRKISKMWKRLR